MPRRPRTNGHQPGPIAILDSIADAVLCVDRHWRLTYANRGARERLALDYELAVGVDLAACVPALRPALEELALTARARVANVSLDVHDPVTNRWLEVRAYAAPEDGLTLVVTDATGRRRTEEAKDRLLAILDATPDLVCIQDVLGGHRFMNRAARAHLGLDSDPSQPDDAAGADEAECDRLLDEMFPIGLERGVWKGERTIRGRGRRRLAVSQVVMAHPGADGRVAYLSTIARDITDRKKLDEKLHRHLAMIEKQRVELEAQKKQLIEANAKLEALATTDGLTGLKNHRAFQERLAEEFARSARYNEPMSVVMIDVDHFKAFNDRFGHPAGDEVLKTVAAVAQRSARAVDLVARYGGEEFVLVLPETDRRGAADAAERIRHAIEAEPWPLRGITVSVGVASRVPATASSAALIQQADQALYFSKFQGRNRTTHYDTLVDLEAPQMPDALHAAAVVAREQREQSTAA